FDGGHHFLSVRRRSSACRESLDSARLIVEHIENILKSQNLECVFDFRRQATDLDIAVSLAYFFDKTHKDTETGGRDVIELLAIDDDAIASGFNFCLDRFFELRSGMSINKTIERNDRQTLFNRRLNRKRIWHFRILLHLTTYKNGLYYGR